MQECYASAIAWLYNNELLGTGKVEEPTQSRQLFKVLIVSKKKMVG